MNLRKGMLLTIGRPFYLVPSNLFIFRLEHDLLNLIFLVCLDTNDRVDQSFLLLFFVALEKEEIELVKR